MGNEFSTLKRLCDNSLDGCQFIERRVVGLERLLDGRCDYTLLALVLDAATLAVVALDWYKASYAHFGGLLQEPFVTLDILRGGDGHRQRVGHLLPFAEGFDYLDCTMMLMGLRYTTTV